jgi:CheY-like chemotaxis protein
MTKVLLADDDLTMITLLKTLLSMEGYQVVTLLDQPGEFLAIVREQKPDILFMDVFLGDLNGCDLVREVRQAPDLKAMKIIMTSGMDRSEECKAAGADLFRMLRA